MSASHELAVVVDDAIPPTVSNPLDLPTDLFRANLQRRQENREILLDWIRHSLKENSDFGSVPTKKGPSKHSLFKPGAEKICAILGLTVHFPSLKETERALLQGLVPEYVMVRCELHDKDGRILADGVGARSLKQDYGDLNKALKMAAKSAQIDAVLRLAALSETFTQDIEDMPPMKAQKRIESAASTPPETITQEQYRQLSNQLKELSLDPQRFLAYCNKVAAARSFGAIRSLPEIPTVLFAFLMNRLPELAVAA